MARLASRGSRPPLARIVSLDSCRDLMAAWSSPVTLTSSSSELSMAIRFRLFPLLVCFPATPLAARRCGGGALVSSSFHASSSSAGALVASASDRASSLRLIRISIKDGPKCFSALATYASTALSVPGKSPDFTYIKVAVGTFKPFLAFSPPWYSPSLPVSEDKFCMPSSKFFAVAISAAASSPVLSPLLARLFARSWAHALSCLRVNLANTDAG
mmetsp:Transcript_8239/g.23536  ORF Transcript_8239/g.23536 Transcript_8239/m.23536 type:complete len:215 (-) Transcript_8239:519-1163(-)